MNDELFPKAHLLHIQWIGRSIITNWWLYARMSNAALLYIPGFKIVWRMPWLPGPAYSMGWDACWRQMHAENHALREENRRLKETCPSEG